MRKLHEEGSTPAQQEHAFEVDPADGRRIVEGLKIGDGLGRRSHAFQVSKTPLGKIEQW
jgi:hypothetical protein